ncbi:TetR/AcrR family transcriptional regulator, partial [Pseudoalteromonas sp. CR1]|nr:TetR/AcrR family transcriptional regulator [Pseudoalteromonas sp. CR1]
RLQHITEQAQDPWRGFCDRCQAYLRMAQEGEIQRIVLQDAPAVLGDTGSQHHCVESLRQLLEALMQTGAILQAPSVALAQLINGSLVNTALW